MWVPRFTSLRMRITALLLGVQVTCVLLIVFLHPFFIPDSSYTDIADITTETLIQKSLTRNVSGELAITPSPALLRYASSRPSLTYAVSDSKGHIADGSDHYLSEILTQIASVQPDVSQGFIVSRTGKGQIYIDSVSTEFGKISIATAGNSFGVSDLSSFFLLFRPELFAIYGPLFIGMIISLPLLIVWALRPLSLVKRAAASIDLHHIDHPLPTDKLPNELRPAVEAINAALERISVGWQQQHFFMANAAHELRTPVAILQARLDLIKLDNDSRMNLGRDVHRLRLLVDQLLTIARLDHQQTASFTTLDLVDLLQEVIADCAPYVLRSGRSIDLQTRMTQCVLTGDREALRSLIMNLVDNATKAEPQGSTINVMLEYTSGLAIITVADHGPGIEVEDRHHIYEPFWRKDHHKPGTGLGLATARDIVTLHGGNIQIHETPGGGSTFRVELPVGSTDQEYQ